MNGSTTPTIRRPNECDVITIFPMGVTCSVLQPSGERSFDGAATLIITGGTPPYTIFWEVGSYAPALSNIGVGEYKATVIDYYGDFTANTTCVLTATSETYSVMCFVMSGILVNDLVYISSESLGLKNGKPYYKIQYGVNIYGYVFWNPNNNQWIFCSTLDCQNTPYNYIDNNNYFYPTGSTSPDESWVITPDSPYLITESVLGLCSIPKPDVEPTDLCGTLISVDNKGGGYSVVENIQFEPSNNINGESSWSATTNDYIIYWNTGSTPSQWTLSGLTNISANVVNNDPSNPPISNWQVFGDPTILSFDVNSGLCSSAYTISVLTTVNDAGCESTGSIIAQASGGQAPYQYSIDGGITYVNSPIFSNLPPAFYTVYIKDSNGIVGVGQTVQITSTPPTSYTLTLSVNYTNNTFTITAPTLPAGVTISFSLNQLSTFSFYPSTLTPQPTYNNITTINTVGPMTLVNTSNNSYPLSGPCTADEAITVIQQTKQYANTLSIGSNQIITGSITNNIIDSPTRYCSLALGYYTLTISNGVLNNCTCCFVNLVNTTPPSQNPIQ
jgi:hypothetical protein